MYHILKRSVGQIVFIIVAVAVMLVGIEGVASFLLFTFKVANNSAVNLAERRHTLYDEVLGWRNIPGITIPDMYGKGRGVSINRLGVRSVREISTTPLANTTRVICTGDSFAFGYGVDDADAWCSVVESHMPRWEMINMGQCGYGVDQSFLLYRRDGIVLRPSINLFTFTGLDFDRMLTNEFYGYGKPTLDIEHGVLKTNNTPVPRTLNRFAWLRNNKHAIADLRVAELATKVLPGRHDDSLASTNTKKEELVLRLFTELVTLNRRANCTTVFIYLPIREDLKGEFDDLRGGLKLCMQSSGWRFIDLTDDFKRLTPSEAEQLFISDNEIKQYSYAAGHYSKAGNAFVAMLLAREFTTLSGGASLMKRHEGRINQ